VSGDDASQVLFHQLLGRYLEHDGAAAQLSRDLGVSEATISRWKDFGAVPDELKAADIATLLGLPAYEVVQSITASRMRRQQLRRRRLAPLSDETESLTARARRLPGTQEDDAEADSSAHRSVFEADR
jgi:hypothetical protein